MEPRQENRNRDEALDRRIDGLLSGHSDALDADTTAAQVGQEFARLLSEESPRLSAAARTQGLKMLQAKAAEKRAQRRTNLFAFLFAVPRWVQIAAVALVVVVIANGVSSATADALPGSLFYPFKRFGEDGQLLLQNTNGQRAVLWMNLANTRLDEVQGLLRSGGQVDPSSLDAVDDSILRALAEMSGTHGDERVQLLQRLLAVAVRQQQIVNQMAQNASPQDRTRYEQTAKLLQGIASYAESPDAALGVEGDPFQFLTPTPTVPPTRVPTATATQIPTETPTPLPTETSTALPTNTEAVRNTATHTAPATIASTAAPEIVVPTETVAADGSGDDKGSDGGSDTGKGSSGDDKSGGSGSEDNGGSGKGTGSGSGGSGSGGGSDDGGGSGSGGGSDDGGGGSGGGSGGGGSGGGSDDGGGSGDHGGGGGGGGDDGGGGGGGDDGGGKGG